MTDKQLICNQCGVRYKLTPDRNIAVHESIPLHRNRDLSYECPQCGTSIALTSIRQPAWVTLLDKCRAVWAKCRMAVTRTISALRRQA